MRPQSFFSNYGQQFLPDQQVRLGPDAPVNRHEIAVLLNANPESNTPAKVIDLADMRDEKFRHRYAFHHLHDTTPHFSNRAFDNRQSSLAIGKTCLHKALVEIAPTPRGQSSSARRARTPSLRALTGRAGKKYRVRQPGLLSQSGALR